VVAVAVGVVVAIAVAVAIGVGLAVLVANGPAVAVDVAVGAAMSAEVIVVVGLVAVPGALLAGWILWRWSCLRGRHMLGADPETVGAARAALRAGAATFRARCARCGTWHDRDAMSLERR
jgi:hypothetical protein